MPIYTAELTGITPAIMHADDVLWADAVKKWELSHKKDSTPGDDRTPAWRWTGYTYNDGEHIAVPTENLRTCGMESGANIPTGKRQQTFKSASVSGMEFMGEYFTFLVDGKQIKLSEILALQNETNFDRHQEVVERLGFMLFVKRVGVNGKKHVRVRPFFRNWSSFGSIKVWDPRITKENLLALLEYAGEYRGLFDWRPGAPKKPGPYGRFKVKLSLAEK